MASRAREPLFHRSSSQGWRASRPQPSGEALRPVDQARFGAGFDFDFASVRVHHDDLAGRSARALGAEAFTVGRDIFFASGAYRPGTPGGDRLLAHELAHAVQQGAAAVAPGITIPPASRKQERDAESGAEAVLAGRAASVGGASAGPFLGMQQANPGHDAAARALEALNRPDPIAGVGNPSEALAILQPLSLEDQVTAVIMIDEQHLLDVLINVLPPGDNSQLAMVIFAVRATSPTATRGDQFAIRAAQGLAQLPQADRDRIIERAMRRRGGVDMVALREGIDALQESDLDVAGRPVEEVDDLATAPTPVMAGLTPGPWNPGGQPIPFYIGNSAHVAIAAYYATHHAGQLAFYNFAPISTIVAAAQLTSPTTAFNIGALTPAEAALRPDIANITRRHVYEIKPASAVTLGATELALYLSAFAKAGLVMTPGPIAEPGTSGTIPGPGGWYIFSAPVPGVITYVYRQPQRRRQRAPQGQPAPESDPSFVESIRRATGLTGAALVIYIIISEGTRVIPVRNLVPVP